jgi:hypothetical protein
MVDLTPLYSRILSRNSGPVPGRFGDRQQPDYGISATLDDDLIRLTLTFRAGSAYCCMEWGCHVGPETYYRKRWVRLRELLVEQGIRVPERLRLDLTVVVEEGALFFDFRRPLPSPRNRGWYDFAPVAATTYRHMIEEIESVDESPPDRRTSRPSGESPT